MLWIEKSIKFKFIKKIRKKGGHCSTYSAFSIINLHSLFHCAFRMLHICVSVCMPQSVRVQENHFRVKQFCFGLRYNALHSQNSAAIFSCFCAMRQMNSWRSLHHFHWFRWVFYFFSLIFSNSVVTFNALGVAGRTHSYKMNWKFSFVNLLTICIEFSWAVRPLGGYVHSRRGLWSGFRGGLWGLILDGQQTHRFRFQICQYTIRCRFTGTSH